MLYLINALSLEAEWAEIYEDSDVRENVFTTGDGQERTVDFLYSAEGTYLRDADAQGFLKYYKNRDFAFAALLPDEGTDLASYVAGLTGERLLRILENAGQETVYTAIPKFESDYSTELSGALQAMGMSDAFDALAANFSAMGRYGEDSLYISRVLHKTKIVVDERGTRAGAVTTVEMDAGSERVMLLGFAGMDETAIGEGLRALKQAWM